MNTEWHGNTNPDTQKIPKKIILLTTNMGRNVVINKENVTNNPCPQDIDPLKITFLDPLGQHWQEIEEKANYDENK